MKKLKTIVVEDEYLPRLSLLAKLEGLYDELEVVDACDSYDSARDSILHHRPDLLFLDIQLQGKDSIRLLEELRATIPLPYVIFTTAYSDREYLMRAIKLSAVDYLLKPIDKAELSHAVAKVTERARAMAASREDAGRKLSFKAADYKLFVPVDDIAWFKAEGNYAMMVTFHGEHLLLESLLSLSKRLPGAPFVRIDRSTIVNLEKVSRLNQQRCTCTLQSDGGELLELSVSKNGMSKLSSLLEGDDERNGVPD